MVVAVNVFNFFNWLDKFVLKFAEMADYSLFSVTMEIESVETAVLLTVKKSTAIVAAMDLQFHHLNVFMEEK